jgi:hypothetical protein
MTSESVRAERDTYLAKNSLSVDSYSARRFPVYFFKWPIYLPNPGFLPWHDLHHVVTGYQTGLVGEAEISAYELRGGCSSLMVFILCVGAIGIAMFVAPRRIIKAWQLAKGARTLYHTEIPYERLLEMNVCDLREALGLPREGCALEHRI